jgi:hypothetical protein
MGRRAIFGEWRLVTGERRIAGGGEARKQGGKEGRDVRSVRRQGNMLSALA